ncbi:hypothetical protein IKE98_01165 [Candidatus Saccharibacteria bacterium]|nr:hypothetical protein [Candidatus Saccharibacteria bacterium]
MKHRSYDLLKYYQLVVCHRCYIRKNGVVETWSYSYDTLVIYFWSEALLQFYRLANPVSYTKNFYL